MRTTLLPTLLALVVCGCLENEEDIEIRADGSVHVVATAKGDPSDLAGGYNVSLAPPWVPLDAGAREWLRRFGTDTGSAEVCARAEGADWKGWFGIDPDDGKNGLALTVGADFASVAEWPRFTAPGADPYRTAYLEKSATLTVDDKKDRVVYTFERTVHGRPYRGFDLHDRFETAFPAPLDAKIEAFEPLSTGEIATVAAIARAEHRTLFQSLAGTALDVAYTRGSASLPPAAGANARTALGGVADELFDDASVAALWARLRAWNAETDAEGERADPSPMEDLDVVMREHLRAALSRALAADRVADLAANELRFGLEWAFTQYDHTLDLADEKFAVRIRMPGEVVAGNFDELDGGAASWAFEFEALRDRDVVMRVVSVLAK